MSTPTFTTIEVGVRGHVGQLVLARPGALNAVSGTMIAELASAAAWFDTTEASVVVVSGAGRVFSAGADVRESVGLLDHLEQDPTSERPYEEAVAGQATALAIRSMKAITIAAAHGTVVGGAAVLLAACDLRILGETTSIHLPEIQLGIPLSWGGISALVQDLGPARTKRLLLTGAPLEPGEALECGFAALIVPEAKVLRTAEELAAAMATRPQNALREIKRRVNRIADAAALIDQDLGDAAAYAAALRDPATLEAISTYLSPYRDNSPTTKEGT